MKPNHLKNLDEWLAWLEVQHPKTIDLGLDRLLKVATKHKLNEFKCPVIIVGGTNGKGSCVTLLDAILRAQGYRTGVYLSPHLCRYNERIRINHAEVSDEQLCQAFAQVNAMREDISLSYFEWGTLAAFLLFQAQPLDVIILEVGLGGRLDAVNCVDADLAIISSVALDHEKYLGDNREDIGFEKAGIFRPHCFAVCGDTNTPETVRRHAASLQTPLFCQGEDFHYTSSSAAWHWQHKHHHWNNLPLPHFLLQNASTVLMALHLLSPRLPIARAAIDQGLQIATLAGRYQQLPGIPRCILDVAHNPAASEVFAQRLAEELNQASFSGQCYAVVGMLKDKDILHTLEPFLSLVDMWYLADLPPPRGATAEQLAGILSSLEASSYECFTTVAEAYDQAKQKTSPDDLMIVFGSFLTVAAVLEENIN